ncbi:MAG: MotA/TolQ/ExbB proton channel family protein [Pirellula sp.]|nr:MotA/TolQ/ExbB proton channel family protein [Pirellula sp.]
MNETCVLVRIVLVFAWIFAFGGGSYETKALGQVPESDIGALQRDAEAARAKPKPSAAKKQADIDFLTLLVKGGVFMIPIGVVSLMVVTFVIDRWIGLRTGKLFPADFRKSLNTMIRSGDVADPRDMYRLCQQSSSAAANVAATAIARTGRPQPEIASAAADALQRQVDRAYSNVRWLNLAAGIAPLLGLLGTVWGLIRAFHDTTQLTAGQNRADFLAVGIYEALVTTLAGLIVAIPAAIASHYFEGRITRVFGQIEEMMNELTRSLERFEGKARFDIIGRELVEVGSGLASVKPPVYIPPVPAAEKSDAKRSIKS